jgi:probable phosphoglycerate mutase
MAVEIFIARHGQDEDNANGILNGHRDRPLTELGVAQAKQTAQGISKLGLKFDAVYTSPLIRAAETARLICHTLGLPGPAVMPELIERDFGAMTGVNQSEIKARCAPDIIETETVTWFLSPKGAETHPDLIERGQRILAQVRAKHKGGKVLLVCHGDIGKMIYAAATGQDWEDVLTGFHFGNGDLIDVEPDGDAHKIQLAQANH